MDPEIYKSIFDLLPEMVFVLDDRRRVIGCNKPVGELLEYTLEDLRVRPFEEFLPLKFREDFIERFDCIGRSGAFDVQLMKPDGTFLDISAVMKHMLIDDRIHHVLIAKDITAQKKMKMDLLKYSNVIHHTANPIQITDANGIITYVNPAFERASGYDRSELVGQNPRILRSGRHSREFWKQVYAQISEGKVWMGQLENRRKDGEPFHTELVISPIIDESGKVVGYLGAHRDITEQKNLERQLMRSQKMESIGTLAAGIAHEVGNPLTSISSLVQVIQRTTKDDFAKEKLELIRNQINRIAHIIRALVDFSRPSTYVVRPTDVNQVVREALNIVQYGKRAKHVQFGVALADRLPAVNLVPDQVLQVFINILINAVDAIEGRQGKITITSEDRGESVEVTIRDTGKGIAPEDLDKVFEPFFTTKEVGKGTGLGLWVSYGIVKNFSGEIHVESTVGEGSTFTVSFPLKG